jgi:hypothetical protein
MVTPGTTGPTILGREDALRNGVLVAGAN